MKIKFLRVLTVVITLTLSSLVNFAYAELIVDTENDSFIDTSTGIEWMDFGINNIHTYDFVTTQLGNGGIYEGWALATSAQVYTMWANAYLGLGSRVEAPDSLGLGQLSVQDGIGVVDSTLRDVMEIMGTNWRDNVGTVDEVTDTIGLWEGSDGLSMVQISVYADKIGISNNDDVAILVDNVNRDDLRSDKSSGFSTMLIKVPEPSTIAIFAFGIIGLLLSRLNKA
ncbi:MAG: PEP-CTERM sorting domain-containing protein [Alteromonadaceae bacterium]|nr:PEP-CTERM sorting domain-containing protein [Alteromonadaceae bacterium]